MKEEQLLQLCKYYNGEKECPYADANSSLWWNGEKMFTEECSRSSDFYDYTRKMYLDALEKKEVSQMLVDMGLPEGKRVLLFYLDLWHGKWFPYDSLDAILDY